MEPVPTSEELIALIGGNVAFRLRDCLDTIAAKDAAIKELVTCLEQAVLLANVAAPSLTSRLLFLDTAEPLIAKHKDA